MVERSVPLNCQEEGENRVEEGGNRVEKGENRRMGS